jgi:recombination protein RecT
MAKTDDVNKAITTGANGSMVAQDRIEQLLARVDVRKRFEDVLRDNAPAFISSIIAATKSNPYLSKCDAMSVVSSAAVAASLNLPINPSLGFAHIVPYKDKAQFQMGWKGFVQLAIRTGQYKTMNTAEVYEGELKSWNRITAEVDIDLTAKASDKVIGYVAFFRTVNGFEKYLYMTVDEIERHARRYSQSYGRGFGPWKDNFPAMAMKTVLKLLLSKYGLLSIEMQKALRADQAVIDAEGEPETFPDAVDAEPIGDAQEPIS